MSDADPIAQFFNESESADPHVLYKTLSLDPAATAEDVRKAYRRAALRCHPDKHAGITGAELEAVSREFQRVGFAFAVLGDEQRRKRYDATGRTDEVFAGAEEMGWDAYFELLFERIDRKVLDEDKAKYQGSEEELADLRAAYESTAGSLPDILARIPHSQHADEARLVDAVNGLVASGALAATKAWTETSADDKARAGRRRRADKESKEAEAAARKLGVWDEFYGDGNKGRRNGDAAGGKAEAEAKDGGEDALAALIQRRQDKRKSGLDALEEKYRALEEQGKKKRKGKKSQAVGEPPEISDADFEALQAKMFAKKDEGKAEPKAKSKRKA
ncbi:hypothetical protein Q5752_003019 [Cryptotrichosporon argae]